MNSENRPDQHVTSLQCDVQIQLRIAVRTTEKSTDEQLHAARLAAHQQNEHAWCAGFLDGEGCITLARTRRTCGNRVNYRARVSIAQNCLETLHTCRDRIAENCVLAQVPHRESYTRPVYQLIYDGIHAYRLLKKLRPFLIRKGPEADVIFEFYRDGQPTRHFGSKGAPAEVWQLRERCYDALRCLK